MRVRISRSWALTLLTLTLGVNLVCGQNTTQLGPVHPEDIKLPPNPITRWTSDHNLLFFGWADGAYTGSSTGEGLLNVETRPNRYGDAWLLNQAAVVLERVASSGGSWWGFRSEFYMGADAALLRPLDGFGPTSHKFGTDFRQAYFSFHLPLLTDGGVEVKLGRQYVPLGYETTMAPYRPHVFRGLCVALFTEWRNYWGDRDGPRGSEV